METALRNVKSSGLPWWTWVVPFFIFYAAFYLSLHIRVLSSEQLLFLPLPIGIILIHWWGPRILVGLFLSGLLDLQIQPHTQLLEVVLLSTHTVISVWSSYLFFFKILKGKIWLPDIDNLLQFILAGILIPVTINSVYATCFHVLRNDLHWEHILMVWTADFAACFSLLLPALYFITPFMVRNTLSVSMDGELQKGARKKGMGAQLPEVMLIFGSLLTICLSLPQNKFWFLYGIFAVLTGVRFGFGFSLLANLLVFIVTYLRPVFLPSEDAVHWSIESTLVNVHFGMGMLSITACITGRVVSDLRRTEHKLQKQYGELKKAHHELDQFVYSASHDLSAPLKSLLGLINISRYERDPLRFSIYLDKMESSIFRLDNFISEILAYSQNNRKEIQNERFELKHLINEVIDNFRFLENFNAITISLHNVSAILYSDRTRLKIILNNLISNAMKYQRYDGVSEPFIRIYTSYADEHLNIHIEDNGEGIPEQAKKHIFNMFYRGSFTSTGSGLGLYIAKEAAEKIGGTITFKSKHGEGSTFTVALPSKFVINSSLRLTG